MQKVSSRTNLDLTSANADKLLLGSLRESRPKVSYTQTPNIGKYSKSPKKFSPSKFEPVKTNRRIQEEIGAEIDYRTMNCITPINIQLKNDILPTIETFRGEEDIVK